MTEQELQAMKARAAAEFAAATRTINAPELVAEVERLRALQDAATEYAAYCYMAQATLEQPMTLPEWYAEGEREGGAA
jgi:hypothetical protein